MSQTTQEKPRDPTLHLIAARRGAATILRAGQTIKVINTSGHQVVDTWAFALPSSSLPTVDAPIFPAALSAPATSYSVAANTAAAAPEYMSMSHTRASLLKLTPELGDTLRSQKRAPMLTLVEDTSAGVHDTLIAACDRWRYSELGVTTYHESCTDNCWDALEKLALSLPKNTDAEKEVVDGLLGLQARWGGRVPDPFNLFMNIPVTEEGEGAKRGVSFEAPLTKEGDYVALWAERDLAVVMSSCPQDVLSINGGKPMDAHFQIIDIPKAYYITGLIKGHHIYMNSVYRPPLRGKQGCWTCRLRKKKCDEGRPHCSTCESLSITCYGYGPKPDWMDNGEKERAISKSIKDIVKYTSRRKRTTQLPKEHEPIVLAPKSSSASVENTSSNSGSSRMHESTPPSDHGSLHQDIRTNEAHALYNGSDLIFYIPADESTLLMHFLDEIFPLQYPMYKPGILDGGRGWLLALTLRTKSLYYAALATSAHHRRMIMQTKMSHVCRALEVQQAQHLENCLKLVNEFAQVSCPYNGLGVTHTVIQLGYYELFAGDGNAWKAHFRAAMNMYQQGYKENLCGYALTEESRKILLEDRHISEIDPLVAEEVRNHRFLGGSLFWLDITSSITAGTAPYLQSYHFRIITPDSQIRLDQVMGCKNWVMLQIGRIAALHENWTHALEQGNGDCAGFQHTVSDISKEIQLYSLTQATLDEFSISEGLSPTTFNTVPYYSTLITNMFACTASLYLHLITYGFHKLELVDTIFSEAMRMLHTHIPAQLLPALVAPLYVIGCVAKQEDQQYFRSAFSSPPLVDPLLKHRERILPILEEIWRGRQVTTDFTWKDCLELTKDVLLF
ncbi:uncharacterized protein BDZ99DRAFT_574386 [Mytilinidion resinicola]|uniref:Zn(2)-C6 fungal-type domain-containing protein n=1 Tax=Mytilinidion resinicola TaxID=574789 RepID=A0A6A6YA64_9PEZI|nr:uncharacterized protein BDZ99DRAFT_574386 [Mytilinidion resinicola]KAF2805448.1 hypothetical protein BDZ99DRAFT_574386 [Mytilinidion resinicola]